MNTVIIDDFGASVESENNREAIERAVKSLENGGTVIVPRGVYLTSTVRLASNVTLYLSKGAILRAIPDASLYEANGYRDSFGKYTTSFLIAKDCENVGIDGEGMIDLSGEHFMIDFGNPDSEDPYKYGERISRPIFFDGCTNAFVRNIEIHDAPCWTVTFHNCTGATFENITVRNNPRIPHNDGVHISASRNVTVRNCDFVCGDDCVAITSLLDYSKNCRNITVSDCRMSSRSAALRIGHIASRVENVHAENLDIYDTNRGVAIFAGNGGSVKNVSIENVVSQTRIYGNWWGKGEPFVITNAGSDGEIANISINRFKAQSDSPSLIIGDSMKNISVENYSYAEMPSRYPELLKVAELQPNGLFEKIESTDGIVRCKAKRIK